MKKIQLFFVLRGLVFSACSKGAVMEPAERLEVKLVVASGWCGTGKTIVMNSRQTRRDLRGNTRSKSSVNAVQRTEEACFNELRSYL